MRLNMMGLHNVICQGFDAAFASSLKLSREKERERALAEFTQKLNVF